jgi:hypothetical protein
MSNMLIPVMEKFKTLVPQLLVEMDEQKQELLAQSLCHAMAVTSRASKAFTNHQTMKSCCCVPLFIEAMKVFLGCLQVMLFITRLYAVNYVISYLSNLIIATSKVYLYVYRF